MNESMIPMPVVGLVILFPFLAGAVAMVLPCDLKFLTVNGRNPPVGG